MHQVHSLGLVLLTQNLFLSSFVAVVVLEEVLHNNGVMEAEDKAVIQLGETQ
jgi:hypothetical protein